MLSAWVSPIRTIRGMVKIIIAYECTISGTKNVGKQMLKISQGRVRDKNVTWFPELVE